MAYITKDARVQKIIQAAQRKEITLDQVRSRIEALPPQQGASFGYLEWEIDDAVAEARAAMKRHG